MSTAPKLPRNCPKRVTHDGRTYPLVWEPIGWRLRSRSKKKPADFRTGTTNLPEAKRRATAWLEKRDTDPMTSRKGGGSLEALAALYLATPKRTKDKAARDNVSRLRSICRTVLGRELGAVTCREVSPALWQDYQRAALTALGHKFDLTTRYRENIGINAAVRAARCLFLPALLRTYQTQGLTVLPDAGKAVMLPVPYVAPTTVDAGNLEKAWANLRQLYQQMWLTIGLARFAGLRREEIAHLRAGWIEVADGAVFIAMRDRPEEQWWTKTGKPYRARVIHQDLAEYLAAIAVGDVSTRAVHAVGRLTGVGPMTHEEAADSFSDPETAREYRELMAKGRKGKPVAGLVAPDTLLVPDPPNMERDRWFEREPQRWLRAHGIGGTKPLHRLRGLYADHIAQLTADAVTARLAGVKAAQEGLGHTSAETTKRHYLTP